MVGWHELTHGWRGLAFGWSLVAVPLWVGLAQGRAPFRKWVFSPFTAILLFVIAGLFIEAGQGILKVNAETNLLAQMLSLLCFVIAGYVGGRLTALGRPAAAHKRGSLIEDGRAVQEESARIARRRADLVRLAGVAIPLEDETKHFKLIGTTGTGKSTAIGELLAGALERGDRAIVADPDGGYLARFRETYRGDVVLNPFEADSLRWDLFAEVREPYDVEQLAGAIIPGAADSTGREWRGYARTFFSAVFKRYHQSGGRDLAELWRLLAVAPTEEVRPFVAGTPAQPFLEADNARMFGSIRSVTSSACAALEYIQAQRTSAFSVREWVRTGRGGRGVLFIPYKAGQITALHTVIAAWMRLAIFEAMSQPEGDQRLWFVIDELDALGTIDGLKDALARLRKFGGRCVLGLQSIAQVSSTYGAGEAQTIVENCGNTLILRCSGSEHGGTSVFASRLIGDREVVRRQYSEGYSRGSILAGTRPRESTNITEQHVTEAAVMPSELEQLPDLTGYLKIASAPAWLRVQFQTDS